jgi:HSP20 family molecular chaperone IbpA
MRIVKAAPVMAKVRNDIDQVFDRLFRTTFAPESLLRTPAPAPEAWLPPFDLHETEAEYVVRLDVPGAHRENLDITLVGTLLTLSGRREFPAPEAHGGTHAEREVSSPMIRLPAPAGRSRHIKRGALVHLPRLSAVISKILIK